MTVERALLRAGHPVVRADDGVQALELLDAGNRFDIIIADWFMPIMDGVELVRRLRERDEFDLPVIVLTEGGSERAKHHVMSAGADELILKPITVERLLHAIKKFESIPAPATNAEQARTSQSGSIDIDLAVSRPTFPVVCIAASTGGPNAVAEFLSAVQTSEHAAWILTQHGPAWMLESFETRLQKLTDARVSLGIHGDRIEPGRLYISPGDVHMMVDPTDLSVRIDDAPPEHFVRPAADPLFRSAAVTFGENCFAVVLTGLGVDGTMGAEWITGAGGKVAVQDPKTCVARSMPTHVIDAKVPCSIASISEIATEVDAWVSQRAKVAARV